jgi:glycosyltransferase involved in cell wall biosynthesis
MPATLTVVIPALNEAERLPLLLDKLAAQTRKPGQIVVADAGSTDGTRELAKDRGAQVVDGGKPAAGRNAGARAATGDLILFLDADVDVDESFVADALDEFSERGLVVASAYVEPLEQDLRNRFAIEVVNYYLEVMQYVAPHAPGFCILVQRGVHEAIGGFDEEVVLAEDHDYVQRAADLGRFRMLRSVPARTSMRRIEKEGLVRLAFKYLYCEMYVVTGHKIHEVPFDYEFASFGPKDRAESLAAVAALRERLGALADTVDTVSSDTLDALVQLGRTDISRERVESALARVRPDDIKRLERYVKARARLARRGPKRAIARVRQAGAAVWRLVRT